MHRGSLPIVISSCVAALLCSCATSAEISGPLSARDVKAIKLVVEQRSDLKKPVFKIDADRPNRARVQCGRAKKIGDLSNVFTVTKRQGRWTIVSPIKDAYVVIIAERGR
jgi:hypothetical protein